MIDKHFISIVRELSVCVLTALVLISVWGRADRQRNARVLQNGSVECASPSLMVAWIRKAKKMGHAKKERLFGVNYLALKF
jgi:hypothetical protein